MSTLILTGCGSKDSAVPTTEEILDTNRNMLTEQFSADEESDEEYKPVKFSQYKKTVKAWAEENSIEIRSESDNYIILGKSASGDLKSSESFVFHTAVDFTTESSKSSGFATSAILMTILSSAENHGDITGIITLQKNGELTGAEAVPAEYTSCDNFIDITYSKDTTLCNAFAGSSDMTAVNNYVSSVSQYSEAYTITFKGKEFQSAYKNRGAYPNPIKAVGDLLASCQTSTILFELAEFTGGTDTTTIPSEVTATIVLHENDVESFIKKFDSSYKKIEDAYDKLDNEEETFEYTYAPADMPAQVICKEDTENIVSLMYTMINGTYLRNEDDVVEAFSNIGTVSTADGTFRLGINAKSLTEETMTDLESVVETICGLSNISYEKGDSTGAWINESALVTALTEAFEAETSAVLEMDHATVFLSKNSELNFVSWGTNAKAAKDDLDKLFEYMSIAGSEMPDEAADKIEVE